MTPILLLAIVLAGYFFGPQAAQGEIIVQLHSLAGIGFLFAGACKRLPYVQRSWRDAWIGARVTAALFALGKHAIGVYLGNGAVASSFGAAGSIVALLAWVYYSAQIFFLGAQFT